MIKNSRQAAQAKSNLNSLKSDLKEFETRVSHISPLEYEIGVKSFRSLIKQIQYELDEYNSLLNGNLHFLKLEKLEELPKILIKARIAQKLSQKELGERVGVAEQQIQRYEATDYESASWVRISEVFMALELNIKLEEIILINTNPDEEFFSLPNGIIDESVRETELLLRQCKCLSI